MAQEVKTMKKTVTVEVDVPCVETTDKDAFTDLLGKKVLLMCLNYFYAGWLVCANDSFLILENAKIVYDTGAWSSKDWSKAESLPMPTLRVNRSHVESWGEIDR